ncbi:MAG: phosphoribosylformylglycinamidine synthase, partial [Anaerovorax sp.]
MVKRIYVEKKQGFDIEAQGLFQDMKENLHLETLKGIRVLNRYDMEGVDQASYEKAKYTIFAEPAIDQLYEETIPQQPYQVFGVEYLPGQYDQRADSAAQCISLMDSRITALVKFARIMIPIGDISETQFEAIKKYCINPVDSQEAALGKPEKLEMDMILPADVQVVSGFRTMTEDQLEAFRMAQGFAMSFEDIKHINTYFSAEEDRDPTITELKVIDTYWSDHCRHTTFMTNITNVKFASDPYGKLIQEAFKDYLAMRDEVYGETERPVTLMDMAVMGTKYLKKKGKL